MFKLGQDAGRPWVWWDYTTRFSEQCSMTSQNYGAVSPAISFIYFRAVVIVCMLLRARCTIDLVLAGASLL